LRPVKFLLFDEVMAELYESTVSARRVKNGESFLCKKRIVRRIHGFPLVV
jgi:hypothetical protein